MKKICFVLIAVLLITVNSIPGMSKSFKGVQAILLHRWSPASTLKLIETLQRYNFREIEVSFAPNIMASVSDPYSNIRAIINGLPDKKVYVTVYLNFHASDRTVNGLDKFKTFFNTYKSRAQIIVCPSLEDVTTVAEINAAARQIAVTVGPNNISSLILRRSPDPNPPAHNRTDSRKPDQTVIINNQLYRYKAVELEKHGVIVNSVGSDTYSNDGLFVYNPEMRLSDGVMETVNSFSSVNTSTKYSIREFSNISALSRTNLWRPAYNLYRDCRGRYLPKTDRTFTDCNNKAFDDEEAKTLKIFLGIQ